MLPKYDVAPVSGPLLQGELLADIYEYRPSYPPMSASEGTEIGYYSIHHPLMIIMNPSCDLDWDFKARFEGGQLQKRDLSENDKLPPLIPHVLLCDAYERDAIRPLFKGRDLWEPIEENKNERYHHFIAAPIGEPKVGELQDIYLDFKKTIALPCSGLYEALRQKGISRVAVIPAVYIHDLMHRFYGFWSRVGLPTPSLIGYDIKPRTTKAGASITFIYTISNLNITPRSVGLQAGIKLPLGYSFGDPADDVVLSAPPGISTVNRTYKIPADVPPGNYEVCWGLWSDIPNSSTRFEQQNRPDYLKIAP